MKNILFRIELKNKAKELCKSITGLEQNRDKNLSKLKKYITKDIKNGMLILNPDITSEKSIRFKGYTFTLDKIEDNKFIFNFQKSNLRKAVLFESVDEVRAVADEIKKEFPVEIEYELKDYSDTFSHSAIYLKFYYIYKQS